MISTRKDLIEYLRADRKAQPSRFPQPFRLVLDRIYRIKTLLRMSEYYFNNKDRSFIHKVLYWFYYISLVSCLRSCSSEIGLNVFGKGLVIWHPERIIVNSNSKVGERCSISTGVIIAQAHGKCPHIGNDVELMVDSAVLGDISVADNVRIGAKALVLKTIDEADSTWAGVPAQMISARGTEEFPVVKK